MSEYTAGLWKNKSESRSMSRVSSAMWGSDVKWGTAHLCFGLCELFGWRFFLWHQKSWILTQTVLSTTPGLHFPRWGFAGKRGKKVIGRQFTSKLLTFKPKDINVLEYFLWHFKMSTEKWTWEILTAWHSWAKMQQFYNVYRKIEQQIYLVWGY